MAEATVRAASGAVARQNGRPGEHGQGHLAHPRRAALAVVAARQRRARATGRRITLVALAVAVAAPLAVVATYADLTSGQVRLTQLQQRLTTEQQQESALELRVARLENPSMIATEARGQGMVPAGTVTDIPEVPLGSSSATGTSSATGSSATGTSSAGTAGNRSTVGNQ